MATTAHRTGILVPEGWPLDRVLDLARRAEARGYWGVFPFEERGHDVVATLAAIASVTRRVTIGSCIGSAFTRTAPIYAMAANTLAELSGGRMILGLGTSPPFFVKTWHDTPWTKPVGRLKDYIRIVRAILEAKEPVSYQGTTTSCRGFQLSVDPAPRRPPIYMAAIGPQMLAAAGEVADGAMIAPLVSDAYARFAVAQVRAGARKAGRDPAAVDILAPIVTVVDEDRERALEAARAMIAYFAVVFYFAYVLEMSGFGELAPRIRATNKQEGFLAATRLVTDDMARALTVVGTPDDCRRRLGELAAHGIGAFVLNAPSPRRVFGQPVRIPVDPFLYGENLLRYLP
jgi:alkanesulfonate monooxygenase SsuD/methylene tetrahydromethanopterin reductase-like flavin-dependent oxidoreductase (luciferase family)